MMINMMLPADADAQRARPLITAGTDLTGHMTVAGSAGAGLVVRMRPWLLSDLTRTCGVTTAPTAASISFTPFITLLANHGPASQPAQPSTAAASGLCASKQYQEKARSAAAIGGALGPLPPRDPV
jgi:hypothetical protein